MTISFIIPVYNEERTIGQCLESIGAEMRDGDQIIVLDNGSTDRSLEIIRGFGNLTVISVPGKTIGALRNAGADIARGDVLSFIDADCVLCTGWRASLEHSLEEDRVTAVGSRYDIPERAVWIERAWYSQRAASLSVARYINSGNFSIRAAAFRQVGGFAEELITGEDAELGWRLCKAGFVIMENPEVRVIHLGNPKTLLGFYRKQKWHALGMMGTFRVSRWDKPLIMTVAFALSHLVALGLVIGLMRADRWWEAFVALVLLSLSVPLITSVYRVLKFRNQSYFLHLVCLYWVFFLARARVLWHLAVTYK